MKNKYNFFKSIFIISSLLFINTGNLHAQVGFGTNSVSGWFSTALGNSNSVSGTGAFTAGRDCQSSGDYSYSLGRDCYSLNDYAFTFGHTASALNRNSFAMGTYVTTSKDFSFVIGMGVSPAAGMQLENNIDSSLMVGFGGNEPTFIVHPVQTGKSYGKVSIGTSSVPIALSSGTIDISDYSLYVQGGILTQEVRVRSSWADYVFEADYELKPLSEVEKFIKTNGHLPNVPTAKTVEESGIEIGEMTKIQQEKIEELTLYIIDLQKQINELRTDVEKVNN